MVPFTYLVSYWKWLEVQTWLAPLQSCVVPGYPPSFQQDSWSYSKTYCSKGLRWDLQWFLFLDTEVPPHSIGQVSTEGQPRFKGKGGYFFSQKGIGMHVLGGGGLIYYPGVLDCEVYNLTCLSSTPGPSTYLGDLGQVIQFPKKCFMISKRGVIILYLSKSHW